MRATWRYVRDVIDFLMDDAGGIRNYAITDFNLDQINPGRTLFALLRETGDARYCARDPPAARATDAGSRARARAASGIS